MPPYITFFYVIYHLPNKTVHYRQTATYNRLEFLELLDKWNACARGTWQYHSVIPGFSCPLDTSRYEEVTI